MFIFPYCLVAEKQIKQTLFFFLLGHKLGPEVAWLDEAHEARQDEFRVLKKAHLLNEPSSVHNGGPTGQVRVLKKKTALNPTRCHS